MVEDEAEANRNGGGFAQRIAGACLEEGAAILLMSEDLDELVGLSDRIVVLYEGRIVGRLDAAAADPEQLGMLMAGRGQERPAEDGAAA